MLTCPPSLPVLLHAAAAPVCQQGPADIQTLGPEGNCLGAVDLPLFVVNAEEGRETQAQHTQKSSHSHSPRSTCSVLRGLQSKDALACLAAAGWLAEMHADQLLRALPESAEQLCRSFTRCQEAWARKQVVGQVARQRSQWPPAVCREAHLRLLLEPLAYKRDRGLHQVLDTAQQHTHKKREVTHDWRWVDHVAQSG